MYDKSYPPRKDLRARKLVIWYPQSFWGHRQLHRRHHYICISFFQIFLRVGPSSSQRTIRKPLFPTFYRKQVSHKQWFMYYLATKLSLLGARAGGIRYNGYKLNHSNIDPDFESQVWSLTGRAILSKSLHPPLSFKTSCFETGRIPVLQLVLWVKWDHTCQGVNWRGTRHIPPVLQRLWMWFNTQDGLETLKDHAGNSFHADPSTCLRVWTSQEAQVPEGKAEETAQTAGIHPSSKG